MNRNPTDSVQKVIHTTCSVTRGHSVGVSSTVPALDGKPKQPIPDLAVLLESTSPAADSPGRKENPSMEDLCFTSYVSPQGVWGIA